MPRRTLHMRCYAVRALLGAQGECAVRAQLNIGPMRILAIIQAGNEERFVGGCIDGSAPRAEHVLDGAVAASDPVVSV